MYLPDEPSLSDVNALLNDVPEALRAFCVRQIGELVEQLCSVISEFPHIVTVEVVGYGAEGDDALNALKEWCGSQFGDGAWSYWLSQHFTVGPNGPFRRISFFFDGPEEAAFFQLTHGGA